MPNSTLKKCIENDRKRIKTFGTVMASKIAIRMAALMAARSLADFWPPFKLPERCHALKGKLTGTFSIDLRHPFRLLFRPVNSTRSISDPDSLIGVESDELEYWKSIEHIEIVGIEDTHD